MDESFILISNNSNNNDDSLLMKSFDSTNDFINNNTNENNLKIDENVKNDLSIENSHDINDSYSFNVGSMLPILAEKKNSVINIIKENNNIIQIEDKNKIITQNDTLKALNEKQNIILNKAKQKNDVEIIKNKLKLNKNNEVLEKAAIKSVEDGYVNDSNDMSDVLKILNEKKSSILETAKTYAENSLIMADSAKHVQNTKRLAAVIAANEEDFKLIAAGKEHRINNNLNDIINDNQNDYNKINEVKSQVFKELFDGNQSEKQFILNNVKSNRQAFLESIIDY